MPRQADVENREIGQRVLATPPTPSGRRRTPSGAWPSRRSAKQIAFADRFFVLDDGDAAGRSRSPPLQTVARPAAARTLPLFRHNLASGIDRRRHRRAPRAVYWRYPGGRACGIPRSRGWSVMGAARDRVAHSVDVGRIASSPSGRRAASGAVAEVSATWGGPQTIGGPVLSVPYTPVWIETTGRQQRSAVTGLLPAAGAAHRRDAGARRRRSRGIFDVVVYGRR